MDSAKISGYDLFHGFLSGYRNIAKHRDHINRINVFPVPDGDTGSNMVRTFKYIAENLVCDRSAGRMLERIAYQSLTGARGNSGIILAQYLNGIARNAGQKTIMSLRDLGRAIREAVFDAYDAMENPQEGTILTVIKVWAESVHQCSRVNESVETVLTRAYDVARKALKRTTGQLKVLKDHNVMDAGAWGFVSFLEGFQRLYREGPIPLSLRRRIQLIEDIPEYTSEIPDHDAYRNLDFRYCTEVLIEGRDDSGEFKAELRPFGDSLVVSRGPQRIRAHIHTNNPETILELSRRRGKVLEQKVDDMFRQEQAVNRRLGSIAVLTDSIADIPKDLADTYQVHVLNQTLVWDDEEYLDRMTITPEGFYRLQQERRSFPGSAAPDAARVNASLGALLGLYEGVIVLPVAKALSGTWRQFDLAAQGFNRTRRRVAVIDTCLNSVGQGLLVAEVAKAAAEGKTLNELQLLAEELKSRVRIFVGVDTFKYMVKGGRVKPLTGFIAGLLNFKPIVTLDESGKGSAFDKSFSTRGLLRKILRLLGNIQESRGLHSYAVVHAAAPEKAHAFAQTLTRRLGFPPAYITSISPIVGMHSGRGALAVGLIERPSASAVPPGE